MLLFSKIFRVLFFFYLRLIVRVKEVKFQPQTRGVKNISKFGEEFEPYFVPRKLGH